MSDLEKRIGGRVTELRLSQQLTQAELAERVQMAVESISRMERGVAFPSLRTMERVAEALGVPLKTLFQFDEEPAQEASYERELGKLVAFLRTLTEEELVVVRKSLPEVFKVIRERTRP